MECNKEEAIRARQIAEVRMQNNDFSAALRIAQKAQRLFPELENISQLLAVCQVHISAQNKVNGSESDWYGILQIEKTADDIIIKKQYRKLALLLHPDKNKFAGAEAAFKLIGEANRVLTDQAKRSLYDMKCSNSLNMASQVPQAHQQTRQSPVRKCHATANKFQNFQNSPFPGSNGHQYAQQATFWTCCPFCNVRYQYYKNYMNRALRCQRCSKPFIATDITSQGMGSSSDGNGFPKRDVPNYGSSKATSQNAGNPFGTDFKFVFTRLNPQSKATSEAAASSRSKGRVKGNGDKSDGTVKDEMPKDNATGTRGTVTSRTTGEKRWRNVATEFAEKFSGGLNADGGGNMAAPKHGNNPTKSNVVNGANSSRKSSRQKQQVSYAENLDNDDFSSPPKRPRVNENLNAGKDKYNNKKENVDGSTLKSDSVGQSKKKGDNVETEAEDVENESSSDYDEPPTEIDCPDPEFNDFDKDKEDKGFAVDQVWACYDPVDGMPRFYGRIRKVMSPGFKLRFTWFETDPESSEEMDWCEKGLPVACGKYQTGGTQVTEDRNMFSHQIFGMSTGRRGIYHLYPRKGEIWALFKNWDLNWGADPASHMPYRYEFVIVQSDFDKSDGIRVAYLSKVKGFVSLFQLTASLLQILPAELYRFSHQVPAFRMTGKEREGVPEGSFELDPAALPVDMFEPNGQKNLDRENEVSNAGEFRVSGPNSINKPSNDADSIGNTDGAIDTSRDFPKDQNTPQKHGSRISQNQASLLRRSPRGMPKKHNDVNENESTADSHQAK